MSQKDLEKRRWMFIIDSKEAAINSAKSLRGEAGKAVRAGLALRVLRESLASSAAVMAGHNWLERRSLEFFIIFHYLSMQK